MARAYQKLTQTRLNGLAFFAREGIARIAEQVRDDTGVNIKETDDAVLRAQVVEYVNDTRVREYTAADLWDLAKDHRLAIEALDIIDKRDAKWKSKGQ